jgi:DNA polymerase-3 subunit alpha
MAAPFVHLHVHTDFSLLDGTASCAGIAALAKEYGMRAVACTDHGIMSGCMEFAKAMKAVGVKPIFGCEFYVAPGDHRVMDNSIPYCKGFHLICLAETYEGYVNLCHLNEEAWLRGYYYNPRVDKELLRQYHRGIIAMSACLSGEIPAHFRAGNERAAEQALDEYLDIFGKDNFFLELQDHGLPEQKPVNEKVIALARKREVGLVLTNDSHYCKKEHAEAHELFLCIGTGTTINDPKRMRFGSNEFYFKSPEEMAQLFPELPEAMANTVAIAERCNVHLPTVSEDKVNHYPEFPVPEGVSREDYLRQQCVKGLAWRYGFDADSPDLQEQEQEKVQRMDFELGVIGQTGFTSYFLVVWDFLRHAAAIGVPLGPGRGSGAGSIVAYCLGITHIDPLRYGLLFERFLNPDRVSPPDFDIDLCERRRHEVIEYVREKYGAANVVQIGTFGTLKAKAVIKDVTRALGRSIDEGNRISKLIPADPKMTLSKALYGDAKKGVAPVRELAELYENNPWVQEIWKYASVLEGLNRNLSIHAAGVIIGDAPVANVCPIAKGANDEPITQFPAGPCEELGLLKMDFLGLKTLTIIQDALDLVAKNSGQQLDSNDIPLDDPATFELINQGGTIAVFQLESSGMQNLCRRFRVNRLEDIIALIALYRPGPMQFLDEFIGRKMGNIPVDYDVPAMKPILEETYGIMLYQEQVMQVVQAVAGFSLGNADILRRAMGKKDVDVMVQQFAVFQEGCRKNGIDDAISKNIWDKILKFAGYGFNKSHSAAYALLSYRTAWLKAKHPAEFMAAVLTSELSNAEKLSFYLAECRAMNINILPPDVNVCDASFSVDGRNVRFGLAAIKGVGEAAVAGIIAARQNDGVFKDLSDFCERVDGLSKRLLENLIKAGALDCFGFHRAQLMAMLDDAIGIAQQAQKDRKAGQGSLFDLLAPEERKVAELPVPEIEAWELRESLRFEKELLGFYVSGHPISQDQAIIDAYQLDDLSDLIQQPPDSSVRIGAYLSNVNQMFTRKDNKAWAILTLESRESSMECLLFPEAYDKIRQQCPEALQPESVVFIEGELSRRDEDEPLKLFAQNIIPLEQAQELYTQELHVRLYEEDLKQDNLQELAAVCRRFPGHTALIFCMVCSDGTIVYLQNEQLNIQFSAEFRAAVAPLIRADALLPKVNRKRPPMRERRFQRRNWNGQD